MKSGENNKLRQQVADLEFTLNDLYQSRKGPGSLSMELDSLKADNERLIRLLKESAEYADMTEAEIIKASKTLNSKGADGVKEAFTANHKSRVGSADKT